MTELLKKKNSIKQIEQPSIKNSNKIENKSEIKDNDEKRVQFINKYSPIVPNSELFEKSKITTEKIQINPYSKENSEILKTSRTQRNLLPEGEEKKSPQNSQNLIKIKGYIYRNEPPPKIDLIKSETFFGDQVIIRCTNEKCPTCGIFFSSKVAIITFPCKHWCCIGCEVKIKKISKCPLCSSHVKGKYPLDTGKNEEFSTLIQGKTNVHSIPSLKDVPNLTKTQKFKLMSSDIDFMTIDDFIAMDITLPQIYVHFKITKLEGLKKRGFENIHISNKKFVNNVFYLRLYGIKRDYIINSTEDWLWYLKEEKKYIKINPVERMFKKGYNLSDFLELEWDINLMEEDKVPQNVIWNILVSYLEKNNVKKIEKTLNLTQVQIKKYELGKYFSRRNEGGGINNRNRNRNLGLGLDLNLKHSKTNALKSKTFHF